MKTTRWFVSARSYYFNQAVAEHFAQSGVYPAFGQMRQMFKAAAKCADRYTLDARPRRLTPMNAFFTELKAKVAAYVDASNKDDDSEDFRDAYYDLCHHVGLDPVEAHHRELLESIHGKGMATVGVRIDSLTILVK
jgi:hypothetical protein